MSGIVGSSSSAFFWLVAIVLDLLHIVLLGFFFNVVVSNIDCLKKFYHDMHYWTNPRIRLH